MYNMYLISTSQTHTAYLRQEVFSSKEYSGDKRRKDMQIRLKYIYTYTYMHTYIHIPVSILAYKFKIISLKSQQNDF